MKAYQQTALMLLLLELSGCSSFALMQTAHTTPKRALRLAAGPVHASNEYENEGRSLYYTSLDVGGRIGVTDSLDIGISPFLALGMAADVKVNVIRPSSAFALAPRLRLGGGTSQPGWAALVEPGIIASYRLFGRFEPYAALGFANYWVRYNDEESTTRLEPNQRLAARRGYGDGLLQGTLGLELGISARWGVVGEFRYFAPMQNDPGDGYRFADSRIVAVALRYQSWE